MSERAFIVPYLDLINCCTLVVPSWQGPCGLLPCTRAGLGQKARALQHSVARVAFHAFIVCAHTHTPPLVLHCTSPAAALSAGVACCQFCCCKGFRVCTPVWGFFVLCLLCRSHEQGGPGAAQAAPPQSEALLLSLCTCSLAGASRHEGICAACESAMGLLALCHLRLWVLVPVVPSAGRVGVSVCVLLVRRHGGTIDSDSLFFFVCHGVWWRLFQCRPPACWQLTTVLTIRRVPPHTCRIND